MNPSAPNRVFVPCAVCGADEGRPWAEISSPWISPERFCVVRCRVCGHRYLNPRPPAGDLVRYYPDGYANFDFSRPESFLRRGPGSRPSWRTMLKELLISRRYGYPLQEPLPRAWSLAAPFLGPAAQVLAYLPRHVPGGKLLEVGCSTGAYLHLLRELGWIVRGVEFQPQAARFARESLDLDVFTGDLLDAGLGAGEFDAAVLFQVLEHLAEPGLALDELCRVLKPGGSLYVSTPNFEAPEARFFGGRWWAWEVPRHLNFFTPKTLTRLLARRGFAVREIRFEPLNHGVDVALSLAKWAGAAGHPHIERRLSGGFLRAFGALYAPLAAALATVGSGTRFLVRAERA